MKVNAKCRVTESDIRHVASVLTPDFKPLIRWDLDPFSPSVQLDRGGD
jgi:hypothetical protein